MNFPLDFKPQSERPTEEGDYLLYNQCDGFHLAEAWFEDGEFVHFYGWPSEPYGEDCYVAWAKLPDTVKDLYERFADKPRGDLSAHDVTMERLAAQRLTQNVAVERAAEGRLLEPLVRPQISEAREP